MRGRWLGLLLAVAAVVFLGVACASAQSIAPHAASMGVPATIRVVDAPSAAEARLVREEVGYIPDYGPAPATFPIAPRAYAGRQINRPRALAVADVDGDSALDVVALSERTGELVWFAQSDSSAGTFASEEVLVSNLGKNNEALAVADLDGNGEVDFIVTDANVVYCVFGQGGGDVTAKHVVMAPTSPRAIQGAESLAIGDIDGDGLLDVLVGGKDANALVWFRNLGMPDGAAVGVEFDDGHPVVDSLRVGEDCVLADLDGDGALDAVTANDNVGEVLWLRNTFASTGDEDDAFAAPVVLADGFSEVRALAVGDVNGDSLPDVLIADAGGDTVVWVANEGGGTFSLRNTITPIFTVAREAAGSPPCWSPEGLATGDLDDDGHLDVIVACNGDDRIMQFRNKGAGLFEIDSGETLAQGAAEFANGAWSVAVADVDDDTKPDIVYTSASTPHAVTWLRYVPELGWSAPKPLSFMYDATHVAATQPSFGAFDVVTVTENAELALRENDGEGAFAPATTLLHDVEPSEYEAAFRACDLTGHGRPDDLLLTHESDGMVVGVLNVRGGLASPDTTIVLGGLAVGQVRALATGDLNQDGLADVVVALDSTRDGSYVGWVPQMAPDVFGAFQPIAEADGIDSPTRVEVADMDGDGRQDVVVSHSGDVHVLYSQADDGSAWTRQEVLPSAGAVQTDPGIEHVTVADVNDDGEMDVIAWGYSLLLVCVQHRSSDAWPWAVAMLQVGNSIDKLRVGDLDGDGLPDLVLLDYEDGFLALLNTGDGLSYDAFRMAPSARSTLVAVGDFDDDGLDDVLVTGEDADHPALVWVASAYDYPGRTGSVAVEWGSPVSDVFNGDVSVEMADMNG